MYLYIDIYTHLHIYLFQGRCKYTEHQLTLGLGMVKHSDPVRGGLPQP